MFFYFELKCSISIFEKRLNGNNASKWIIANVLRNPLPAWFNRNQKERSDGVQQLCFMQHNEIYFAEARQIIYNDAMMPSEKIYERKRNLRRQISEQGWEMICSQAYEEIWIYVCFIYIGVKKNTIKKQQNISACIQLNSENTHHFFFQL